jgi:hypothetical protein
MGASAGTMLDCEPSQEVPDPAPKPQSDGVGAKTRSGSSRRDINLHHSDPKFLGGDPKQILTPLDRSTHIALHNDLNAFLRQQTDPFGNHMRPLKGNSGDDIQLNFTRAEMLDALQRFYSGPGAKYSDAARDFFLQHPELEP